MQDLELKRKRIETAMKIVGLIAACFILGPFYLILLHGMAALFALLIALGVGFVVVNFLPTVAAAIANWRLKALKAVAAANPIETLENQYGEREKALVNSRENIKQTYAILQELYSQIQEHDEKYPGKPSQYLEKYNKLKALVELRGKKYKQAQVNLATFHELIEEKRADWKIAQTMAAASKLANVGEDFQSKLMQDTALSTVQDGLNLAFSELDASLLDEQPTVAVTTVDVSPSTPVSITNNRTSTTVAAIPEKCSLPSLDLGFNTDTIEPEVITVDRRKRTSKQQH